MRSRDLDAKVAEAMGWTEIHEHTQWPHESELDFSPGQIIGRDANGKWRELQCLSTDNTAALQLVEWMRERGWYCQLHISPDYYWVRFVRWNTPEGVAESKERLSEAICIAFLRAMGKA